MQLPHTLFINVIFIGNVIALKYHFYSSLNFLVNKILFSHTK